MLRQNKEAHCALSLNWTAVYLEFSLWETQNMQTRWHYSLIRDQKGFQTLVLLLARLLIYPTECWKEHTQFQFSSRAGAGAAAVVPLVIQAEAKTNKKTIKKDNEGRTLSETKHNCSLCSHASVYNCVQCLFSIKLDYLVHISCLDSQHATWLTCV